MGSISVHFLSLHRIPEPECLMKKRDLFSSQSGRQKVQTSTAPALGRVPLDIFYLLFALMGSGIRVWGGGITWKDIEAGECGGNFLWIQLTLRVTPRPTGVPWQIPSSSSQRGAALRTQPAFIQLLQGSTTSLQSHTEEQAFHSCPLRETTSKS